MKIFDYLKRKIMGPDIVPIPSNNVVSQLTGWAYFMKQSTGEVGTMVDGVFVPGRITPFKEMLEEVKRREKKIREEVVVNVALEKKSDSPFSGRKLQI